MLNIIIIGVLALIVAFIIYYIVKTMGRPLAIKQIEKDINIKYYSAGIEKAQKLLKKEQNNHKAHYLLAKAYHQSGSTVESLDEYRKALRGINYEPSDFEISVRKGISNALFEMGNLVEAAEEYQLLIKVDPKNMDAYGNLAHCYKQLNEFEKAAEFYGVATKLNSKDDRLQHEYGKILYQLGRLPDAMRHLEASLRVNAANYEAYFFLGHIAYKMGDMAKAVEHFSISEKLKDYKEKSRLYKSICFNAMGNHDQVVKLLRPIIRDIPKGDRVGLEMKYELATAYEKLKEYGPAIELWESIIQVDTTFKDVRAKLATYEDVRESDGLKNFVCMSAEDFKRICEELVESMGYKVHDHGGNGKDEYIIVARGKADMVGTRARSNYFMFFRDGNTIQEKSCRDALIEMKKTNCQETTIFTTSAFSDETVNFANTRPVNLINPAEFSEMIDGLAVTSGE